MPRQARLIPEQGYLHVICRGNNRKKLFFSQRDFKVYYNLLNKIKKEESIKILHYCFMPNHTHFLVEVGESSNLSRFIKRLNLKYSAYYREKHAYTGYLWQGRFKSKIIEKDEYFIQCGKYIELNPVKANIVSLPQDYPFSSYLHYALGIEDKIIDENPLYPDLGKTPLERQLVYRNMFINEIVAEKLK
ncbi:MAG: transposase [Candidatus Omnitrophica bacterium]|nr:transposase [Candidatus Omnitrophota bacterium]